MNKQEIVKALLILALVIVGIFGFITLKRDQVQNLASINSFEECADAGYPVMESYPEQCRVPNGKLFTRDIGNELEKLGVIRIDSPRPGQTISSPFTITGGARGYWFFEADFPVELRDANSNTVAQHFATAQSDWMTEDFVPFKAILEFEKPQTRTGTLILKKDNPSGLPENDDALIVPVVFE